MPYKNIHHKTSNKKNNNKQITQKPNLKLVSGWFNDSVHIKYDQVKEICDFGGKGKKLFGYLPEQHNEKLWHNALDRGLASGSHSNHGVKILQGKLLELKDCSVDARLFTKIIYKNEQGDSLAIFDHETNHKGIEREVSKTKHLEEITNCASECYVENSNSYDSTEIDMLGSEISHEIYSY